MVMWLSSNCLLHSINIHIVICVNMHSILYIVWVGRSIIMDSIWETIIVL